MRLNFPFFSIAHLLLSTSCLERHDRALYAKILCVWAASKKKCLPRGKNTISTCLMMKLKFRFHYTTFPLSSFPFSFISASRFHVHKEKYIKFCGENGEVFSCFTKFHIAAGSNSAVHLIFFCCFDWYEHTPIPFPFTAH